MRSKEQGKFNIKDLIIKIVLIVIIILLLIHNCVLLKNKDKYQNNYVPNGNVDVIEIKCDSGECEPVPTPKNNQEEIESLNFTQKTISIKKGDKLGLTVIIKPSKFALSKLNWKSSDPLIASVDANGVIRALKEGTVTITATSSNGKAASCTVIVTNESVDVLEIKLNPSSITIKEGSLTQISATVMPSNATNRELVWTSSDISIATVNNKGVIKGIKAGTTTIIAKTKDGKVEAIVTVTVETEQKQVESLSFAQENVSVKKNKTLGLVVEVKPTELSSTKLTWKSSDSSIATVDENGVVKGLREGTVTITVTSTNGKKATCTVTVTEDTIPVEEIHLSVGNEIINVGNEKQISATVVPIHATDRELVWTSSDTSIATVDANGIVRGIKAGTVTITAKTKDGKVKATCTVTIENDDNTDTFKVYDNEKPPVTWNGSDDLKIFTRSIYDVRGVIAPEYSNTYQFVVKNSTEYNIKYKITFNETNLYHINMKYKLKKNDTYVIDHYVSFNELNITDQLLNSDSKDTYYLEWKWVSSDNDTSIGTNPEATYGLQIVVEAESINE